ncbi:MAG TPA: permease prefix domain 1-containing protein, partial [Candidatus Aquilonibacter sp.]|nr:permease prefix domain 1-containing protein [Candidatus Aquilonibacter sp.]
LNLASEDRRELETHLRDAIAGFQQRGLNDEESFWLARERIGQLRQLGKEFKKVRKSYWNKPIALAAWAMFIVSLFLPAANVFGHLLPGYACALIISPFYWQWSWSWLLATLNYANLMMMASPILLFYFGDL